MELRLGAPEVSERRNIQRWIQPTDRQSILIWPVPRATGTGGCMETLYIDDLLTGEEDCITLQYLTVTNYQQPKKSIQVPVIRALQQSFFLRVQPNFKQPHW